MNRGSLGSASLLTSSLTLVNGNDTITVEALWDPGSELSFFSSDLLPFSVHRRDQSQSTTTAEVVHGVEAAFEVQIPAAATLPTYLSMDDTAGDTRAHGEDQEEFEKLNLEIRKDEIRKFRTSGSVSKNIHDRLELFSAKPVTPEHVWKPSCKQCSKCKECMETGG